MTSPILQLVEIPEGVKDKSTPANQLARDFEAAGNQFATITQTDNDTFLDTVDDSVHPAFCRNFFFDITGSPSQTFEVIVPEFARLFAMRNSTSQVGNIRTGSSAGTSVSLNVNEIALIQSTGTDLIALIQGVP
jgi:hypothetical protein